MQKEKLKKVISGEIIERHYAKKKKFSYKERFAIIS